MASMNACNAWLWSCAVFMAEVIRLKVLRNYSNILHLSIKKQYFRISKFWSIATSPLTPARGAVLGRVENVSGACLVERKAAATVNPCNCIRFTSSPFFVAQAARGCGLVGVTAPTPTAPDIWIKYTQKKLKMIKISLPESLNFLKMSIDCDTSQDLASELFRIA
jgi:hypothetical protein